MQINITERFLRDFQGLSSPLANKSRELMNELGQIEPTELRQKGLPGWRLHNLRGSNLISISVDMNFRILAEMNREVLILHRVVKHDTADRADVNRNDRATAVVQMSAAELQPEGLCEALHAFGVVEAEAERFRGCLTDDDILLAAADVSTPTSDLALTLYETSGLVIPQARFRMLQKDEECSLILGAGGGDWEIYLHPSQTFLVELQRSFRAAVVGSAGTGKTICAWHRAKHLIEAGVSVGFVCPNESILSITKERLLGMVGLGNDRSYFFVPKQPDELIQLAEAVDHLIVDEAQEIPVTWFDNLGKKIPDSAGVTLFYDINQLGGNIEKGDVVRYRQRITDWKAMLEHFPRMQKFSLCINYRNAREIADFYLALLSDVLPVKPLADIPVFETGEVVCRTIRQKDLLDVMASLLYRLLRDYESSELGVIVFNQGVDSVRQALAGRHFSVTDDPGQNATIVTTAKKIRGHERQVMIIATRNTEALRRNYGVAIDAYIAMSRAIKRLIVMEVTDR